MIALDLLLIIIFLIRLMTERMTAIIHESIKNLKQND